MRAAMETVVLDDLTPDPRNARTHDRKHVRQIADSIARFGFCNPVLIDEGNVLIAGHPARRSLASGQAPAALR